MPTSRSFSKAIRSRPRKFCGFTDWARRRHKPGALDLATLQRDYAKAERVAANSPANIFSNVKRCPVTFRPDRSRSWRPRHGAALFCRWPGLRLKSTWRADPGNAGRHAALGLLYAYMQRQEDGHLKKGRWAVELEPESRNAYHGAAWVAQLALGPDGLTRPKEQAITLIERLLSTPGPVGNPSDVSSNITLADLRLRWEWDSLRSNPRFQKILAGPERKTIY